MVCAASGVSVKMVALIKLAQPAVRHQFRVSTVALICKATVKAFNI